MIQSKVLPHIAKLQKAEKALDSKTNRLIGKLVKLLSINQELLSELSQKALKELLLRRGNPNPRLRRLTQNQKTANLEFEKRKLA